MRYMRPNARVSSVCATSEVKTTGPCGVWILTIAMVGLGFGVGIAVTVGVTGVGSIFFSDAKEMLGKKLPNGELLICWYCSATRVIPPTTRTMEIIQRNCLRREKMNLNSMIECYSLINDFDSTL